VLDRIARTLLRRAGVARVVWRPFAVDEKSA
jgi:hypothetical protein